MVNAALQSSTRHRFESKTHRHQRRLQSGHFRHQLGGRGFKSGRSVGRRGRFISSPLSVVERAVVAMAVAVAVAAS